MVLAQEAAGRTADEGEVRGDPPVLAERLRVFRLRSAPQPNDRVRQKAGVRLEKIEFLSDTAVNLERSRLRFLKIDAAIRNNRACKAASEHCTSGPFGPQETGRRL